MARHLIADPEPISAEIIDAAVSIHRELGPRMLESVYQRVMAWELDRRGFSVEREREVHFRYRGHLFRQRLRVDLFVNGLVVVELKSVEALAAVHFRQLQTYLNLLDAPLGLLLNFGAVMMKGNMRRVVNNHVPSALSKLRMHEGRGGRR